MKTSILCAAVACLGLMACNPFTGPSKSNDAWAAAALEIAKDPTCAHSDLLDVMLGPISTGHVHLERKDCKTISPTRPAATGIKVGDVVAPADPAAPH